MYISFYFNIHVFYIFYAKIITSISRSHLLIVYENIKINNYNCLHVEKCLYVNNCHL